MKPRVLPLRLLVFASALSGAPLHGVDIIAHRGASHDAPENTLASARLAWTQDADAVEVDIHLSKDGQIVVTHDFNLKRVTGRDAEVKDLTMAELRELDAGRWKGPAFDGEKLPTLGEVIALLPPHRRLLIEIKTGPEIVPALVRCLARTGMTERQVTIISFNYESLREVRKQLPRYSTLYLVGYKKPDPSGPPPAKPQPTLDELIAQARAAGLTGLDLQRTWPLTVADTKRIKDAGLQLHVWTIDDPAIAKHWIELGVASITTNRPGWLREQLQK